MPYEFDGVAAYQAGDPSDLIAGSVYHASPDTGYVRITNNGSSTFTGTVGFNAVSPCNGDFSQAYPVTLNPGDHVAVEVNGESSNQGGYNGTTCGDTTTPQNGAQFEMKGTVSLGSSSQSVDLTIYDKDIHSGVSQTNPFGVTLDNYILQGGDPYGRDTGDGYEESQTPGVFQFPPVSNPSFIAGEVEVGGTPVAGAHVEACPTSGGSCIPAPFSTNSGGGFSIEVPAGTYSVTVLAPTSFGNESSQTVGPFTVPPSVTNVVVNFAPSTIPSGVTFNGYGAGQVPTVFWGSSSALTVPGCANGFGAVFVQSTNTTTGLPETVAFPLTETPPGSGTYIANLPALAPLHGDGSIDPVITCPGQTPLLPDGGDPSGGTTVVITGTGFTGATSVMFGPSPASSFTVLSDNVITAVSPPGAGNVPVSVSTPSGDQPIGDFNYFGVTALSTASGSAAGGTTVTISGEGFTNVKSVIFGIMPASSFTVVSPTEIQATTPVGVGTVDVQVMNGFALSGLASADLFSYQGGPAGSSNVNEGTGSDGPLLLATQLSDLFPSPPPDSPFNFLSKFSDFLHQMFSPNGTGVHIVVSGILVLAGLALAPEIVGAVLAGVGIGIFVADLLDVKNAELCLPAFLGGGSDCPWFGVKIDPSGNVVDTSGNPINGATATVLGQGPSGFAAVDPSSGAIDPAQNPETTGSDGAFEWEALAGTYEVQATAPNCHAPGSLSQPNVTTPPFVIPPPKVGLLLALECPGSTPPTPTVTGVSTGIGPSTGGNRVEIMGTGLADASAVHFGNAPATGVTPISPFAVAATAPAGTSTVNVTVTTPGGTSATSSADQYTYVPLPTSPAAPSISSVTPGSGPVWGGTSVAIKGSNLDGVWDVSFGGVPAVQVTDVSSTEVDAITPSSLITGPVDVTATGPDGTSAINGSDVFKYTPGVSASTATSLTSSDNPSVAGEQIAYAATVSPVPSGGTVDFRDGGTTISGCGSQPVDTTTGEATCMVTYSGVGTHVIDAVFSGSPGFTGSTSNSITQVVNQAATTVTLLFSPTAPVFGSSDTIMATVGATAPGAGTPTGSVSFYEGGSVVAKVSLSGGAASIAALLQAGTQSIKAVYSGDTNFMGSNTTASASVGCTKTLSDKVTGSMTVSSGQSLCLLSKDVVKGTIKVGTGGALFVAGGSSVSGSISASGAAALTVCASTVTGGASITGSTGFVLLGDAADDMTPSCGPDTFANSLYLSHNKDGVELGGSTIKGSVTLNNTTIASPPPFASIAEDLAAPELESNAITENLSCSGNNPAPTNDGHPNSVKGTKSGQCSNL